MPKIIPINNLPSSEVTVTLSGNAYNLETIWNTRAQGWYMAVSDKDKNLIIDFERITANQQIVSQNRENFPDGQLIAYPIRTAPDEVMGRDNFGVGKSFEVWYFTNEELDELLGR